MKSKASFVLLAALALLSLGALHVRADGVGVNEIGRYRPLSGPTAGELDTWTGTLYYSDPSDAKSIVVVEITTARFGVRPLETGKGSWQAPPVLPGSALPDAKGTNFV